VCYSIFLSTDSSRDLSAENSELLEFKLEAIKEPFRSILQHEHQWYVGSKSRCSCTFRHLYSTELGFSEPVDWYPEDEDEIEATLYFIKIIRQLVDQSYKVDCVNIWNDMIGDKFNQAIVNLEIVSDEQFRFFENFHFIFTNQ
jgi:hypothetical protein